ncbi:MAG TPA: uroporphyrinogen-III C-methyltransferase [Polyangia bacterium]|jgi:uroporphyrin-III C-methyltransferase/precorrin-2 dehydrogenase/sirohydrochlorin ferrochelatase|nr:uroporphyrinogen-III C-methyltransferase [Polyangia bacterium]
MLFPLFLKLAGRDVLVVGAGPVGTSKARALLEAGARVTVVAPDATSEVRELAAAGALAWRARAFAAGDLEGAWLVVAAATPDVNRAVAAAAEARHTFVLAVDDPASASAYGAGVVRRGGVTVAVSTDGRAPALAGLVREGLEAVLPDELASWTAEAERVRAQWKAAGVPMAARRPLLLDALNRLYAERESVALPQNDAAAPSSVRVSLVGAGPGDPELITVRGARRLADADLVLYDALGSERLRDLAPRARWFYVGKRACRQSIGQDVLNRLLVKNARRGLKVVRLKCGDPFVFGRGGEEALALAEAGFACEIVPGISSAVAAPALAGIPVTHRGMASSFAVITGHHEETYAPLLASFAPGSLTLVVMMGLRQRARVAELLMARGWDRATPAAVVVGAATPESWRWTGALEGLGAAEIPPESREAPGLLVIGEVVRLAGALRLETGATDTRSLA